jgi:hypothetical protein
LSYFLFLGACFTENDTAPFKPGARSRYRAPLGCCCFVGDQM